MEALPDNPLSLLNGNKLPHRIYGTAVRKDRPTPDIPIAIQAGYRAIDTASTRLAHNEVVDGQQLQWLCKNTARRIRREDLFIQSKFTPAFAHSEFIPYDSHDSPRIQVFKSAMRSAEDLRVDVFDAYMLQYPTQNDKYILEVWKAMEELYDQGAARHLGLCHASLSYLEWVWGNARIKPTIVQNRLTKINEYDADILQFCKQNRIVYQVFGLFAEQNGNLMAAPEIVEYATKYGISRKQAFSSYLSAIYTQQGLAFCVIDGSSNLGHIQENLIDPRRWIKQPLLGVQSFSQRLYPNTPATDQIENIS